MLRVLAALFPILLLLATVAPQPALGEDGYAAPRERMLEEIRAMARETGWETGRLRFSESVMAAIGKVPRHRFVPPEEIPFAYENRPLPIGEGQTISQPYIVALMTDLLDPQPRHVVLEIGTGSGYQAAVLAELVAKVHTVEVVAPLAYRAERLLRELGYRNVFVHIGDGYFGLPSQAPFDSIIVTAAAGDVPPPLLAQLKPGGRMVIPVAQSGGVQELLVVEKQADGTTVSRRALPVRFVPLVRPRQAPK